MLNPIVYSAARIDVCHLLFDQQSGRTKSQRALDLEPRQRKTTTHRGNHLTISLYWLVLYLPQHPRGFSMKRHPSLLLCFGWRTPAVKTEEMSLQIGFP